MIIMPWSRYVNTRLAMSGNYGHEDDYVNTLKFESGKERIYLKNNFVPRVYQDLGLLLNDIDKVTFGDNDTEYKQFMYWYETILRYGILPFYFQRINYPNQQGIYQFIPGTLSFEGTNLIEASFGWKEIG